MAVKNFLKTGGMAALAAGLAVAALPASADAQERGRWRGGGEAAGNVNGGSTEGRPSWRGGGENRTRTATPPPAPQPAAPPPQRNWSAGAGAGGNAGTTGGWRGNRGGNGGAWAGRSAPTPPPATTTAPPQRNWNGGGSESWRNRGGSTGGNTTGTWTGRSGYADAERDRNRNDQWRGDRNRGDGDRSGDRWRGDRNRSGQPAWRGGGSGYNNGYNNGQSWNRTWRNDNRYDWRAYRNTNRNAYRLGRYYAPYSGWTYRRLSIGFYLDSLFFGSNYWINDPWEYRLPEAYGPYRWVRYYDDALLVDTYTGEVVDVIYDFFW